MNRIFIQLLNSIILTLNQWSFAITARTTSTFWSLIDEIGLPERGSSSTFSRPSLKALCHLKIRFSIEWHLYTLRLKKQMSLWQICWFSHKIWYCTIVRYFLASQTRLYTNSSSAWPTQPIQLKQVWTCSQGHYQRADIHQRGATLPIHT